MKLVPYLTSLKNKQTNLRDFPGSPMVKTLHFWDFPGGPVGKTSRFQCRGPEIYIYIYISVNQIQYLSQVCKARSTFENQLMKSKLGHYAVHLQLT